MLIEDILTAKGVVYLVFFRFPLNFFPVKGWYVGHFFHYQLPKASKWWWGGHLARKIENDQLWAVGPTTYDRSPPPDKIDI